MLFLKMTSQRLAMSGERELDLGSFWDCAYSATTGLAVAAHLQIFRTISRHVSWAAGTAGRFIARQVW